MFDRAKMWRWHRWLGYLIGIQVLLWIFGGLVMSWFDIETVRSEHRIADHSAQALPPTSDLISLEQVVAQHGPAKSVRLQFVGPDPAYIVEELTGAQTLVDAVNGTVISPLSAERALALALYDFEGDVVPSEPVLLDAHDGDYRAALPVWKIAMNDGEGTNLYIAPDTGRVVARRSDVWRIFDFFWMLHIMDYENRSDFNHPLLIGASFIAVLFTLTGGVLSYYRLSGRRRKRR